MLAPAELIRLMDEAAGLNGDEDLYFHVTGGEPFLDFDTLLATVAHAGSLNARVGCTTNAFWARTTAVATQKLTLLRDAGLRDLAVSTSRFHEEFVPLGNVSIALETASRLGLSTELKGVVTQSDVEPGAALERWRRLLDADTIRISPVIPYLREGFRLPDHEYIREKGLPESKCPSELLTIEPDGTAMSCCGQASQSKFVTVGDVRTDSLATLHGRMQSAARQRVLRDTGPIAFARAAISAGRGHLLRDAYAGPCDLCVHIATEPELRRIADEFTERAEGAPAIATDQKKETTNARTKGITQMKAKNLDQLQKLVARAAREKKFCKELVTAPVTVVKSTKKAAVDKDAAKIIDSIKRSLRRFGGNPNLSEEDANNWAVGVLARSGAVGRGGWFIDAVANHPRNNTWFVMSHPKNNDPDFDVPTNWQDVTKTAKKTGKKKAANK